MTQDGQGQPESPPTEKNESKAQGLRHTLTVMKSRVLRWPTLLIVASLLALVFASVFSLGLLPKYASSPLKLAMVTSTSGSQAYQGLEASQSVQLYINAVNQAGGVNGHPIQLQVFNDEFNPATAQKVARQVAASPSLLVLGPIYSAMAVPPNPIYKDARIPLITGTVSSDRLTSENPYAFRLRTPITSQGDMTATYIRRILGVSTASVVYADDPDYGQPSAEAFKKSFVDQGGSITQYLSFSSNLKSSSQLDTIATTLANTPNPGIIYIVGLERPTHDVIVALRRHNVSAQIFCTGNAGQDEFAKSFVPEEGNQQPGAFTEGVYTASQIIFDSAADETQAFATQYRQTYGDVLGTYGAMFFASAQVAVAALKNAHIEGTLASLKTDREQIAQQLGAMDSLQASVATLAGPVYFDHQTSLLPLRFGQFSHGRLNSLPTQLMPALNLAPVDLAQQLSAGEIIQVGDQYYWKQHVIYTGIDINKISGIDTTASTFSADFFFWMRFDSSEEATAVAFANASNLSFDANAPLTSQTISDGLLYRLYHVTGQFKATYDFHDYPFDQQQLRISFQNTRLTNDRLIYAIDTRGLRLRDDNTPDPTRAGATLQSLSSWNYLSTQYASNTFTSDSTKGDPHLFDQQTVTAYSGLQVTMTVQRKSVAYMISHLLPLLLLFLLVYTSLLLSHNDYLKERLSLVVTALLTSAVLLLSINSQLPEIGYVVSLQYIYYIFFLLCFLYTLAPMLMKRMDDERKKRVKEEKNDNTDAKDWRNVSLHIIYLVVVFSTIIGYLITYGNRFG